ncbi:cbb3-type cytochrome c oxidase subunit I [Anaeromyxobacter sp. Fw109-5]|uniref:cbb3-type cytochrome c oxidase subunit I n=1 Tax=Anaeromyxobacter sp. (strain Fw109-5) TaxID=404589 RepID=UPI000158A7D7|nr:cbb3-type cytochrome c oxidase subunit I [Anaeromyxobacter sp. Fw109-5]ABS26958.1 Nitric-oxide reductase [Anaeromyxobacter sp. Fw109-5]
MNYQSQRVAYPYFVVALLLFVAQVLLGLFLAFSYFFTLPQGFVDVFPFSTARAIHTNLLVLWLLLGFMGATYYMVPEETGRELASPKLAIAQLVVLTGTGVVAIVGFLFGWTQGRPLLEIPRPLDLLVVAGALMFLGNVGATMLLARRFTVTQGSLLAGLVFLAVLYLFGIPFYRNLATDWYYWWWVIHLWVEGAWELVTAALVAFMLIHLTGVERRVVEKWLYVELGLFLFTGIAGTGHHYYWLGTPRYWLWVGGVFSALEPLPILLMLWDTFRAEREGGRKLEPRLTWTLLIGMAVLHFVGAGLFGLAHTLPQINYYTHGSQVTVSHGHLAFYGAYVLVNLTFFYFAIPRLRALPGGRFRERRGQVGFWAASFGLVGMSLAFSVAGVLQSYLERMRGEPYIVSQEPIRFWMLLVFLHGLLVLAGAAIIAWDLLTLRSPPDEAARGAAPAA